MNIYTLFGGGSLGFFCVKRASAGPAYGYSVGSMSRGETFFFISNQIHFNVNYDDIRACVCRRLFDLKIIIFSCLFVTQIN